jgi:ribosomal protein L11 methyltransferase
LPCYSNAIPLKLVPSICAGTHLAVKGAMQIPEHCFFIRYLPREQAQSLADALEARLIPEALAVSTAEFDEAADLWELVAYYPSQAEAEQAREFVLGLGLPAAILGTEALPQTDWVAQSLKGLAPVVAGRFYLHGSHDRPSRPLNGHPIEIDAGTAFGTGHHGTTRGCLLAFEALLKQRKPTRVLDLGCGTGVLGIAAALSTKTPVMASDIDPEAVRVSLLNGWRNGAGPLLKAVTVAGTGHRALRESAPYDVIFANILARPLIHLAPSLARLLTRHGAVILSGLTHDQERMVSAAYRNQGLHHVRRFRLEGWSCLVMAR